MKPAAAGVAEAAPRAARSFAAAIAGRSLAAGLRSAYYASALYGLTLRGRVPDRLLFDPTDPITGDPARGDALFQGRFTFAGHDIVAPHRPLWQPAGAPEPWLEEMHAFAWLRHFRANGGETARRHARALVGHWCDNHAAWHPLIWRLDVLGRRLAAWLVNAAFLLKGADDGFRVRFLDSLARQDRHLSRSGLQGIEGARRLAAIKGLVYGALCLHGERRSALALRHLEAAVARQVLADGGHFERSPALQHTVLADLAELRALLLAANQVPPEPLLGAIDRMAPMLRSFRHGDGGLALFNGSVEGSAEEIDQVLALTNARGKPLVSAPHSGFQRLSAKRTLVIVDTGPPAPAATIHAGTLAFEMSVGRQRMVVNCGAAPGGEPAWRQALSGTSAHSTVVVEDTNSTAFGADHAILRAPRHVACARREQEGNIWIDASHDGYRANFGIVHHRRLFLFADGDDLRGEDRLVGGAGRRFAVRFHLHPDVQASLVQTGDAVLLRVGTGGGWRFRAVGGNIGLTDSVYFGIAGERRRSEQIVVSGRIGGDGALIKWAFRKYAGPR